MVSRFWIEYHNVKGDGSIAPKCGTDGFQPLDGRLSIQSAKSEARRRALKQYVKPSGFRICRGTSPTNAYPVTPFEATTG